MKDFQSLKRILQTMSIAESYWKQAIMDFSIQLLSIARICYLQNAATRSMIKNYLLSCDALSIDDLSRS